MAATAAKQLPHRLHGWVAIVTVSSRGIGRALAIHLASLGAKVVVDYTANSAQAEAVAAKINSSSHGPAIAVQADVSNPNKVKSLFDTDARRSTSCVNTRGAFLCCKEASHRLKRGGGGRIVLLSSSLVAAPTPNFGAYTASKAGMETMVKILAKELKGTQITANSVALGPIATEMFFEGRSEEEIQRAIDMCPLGRLGETQDVAPIVRLLASDAGEWVNGQIFGVNGGYA
ncbi:hypothetical protein CDL15_Pgr002978 [Punica granatum]|uniref:NADPH-dependent aldehyde reductase-like protein, chloroplastic n=1 Tax=Punica granatum TaxID=22663 RepID=A0A218X1C9_PUNGR|nr:hypothetical protein CDL15_Pgr002978 [Punica granatum]